MENYNIYDEIGRGTHSFVYKARRKRSIEYVAVKSTAKCRMEKVIVCGKIACCSEWERMPRLMLIIRFVYMACAFRS